MIITIFFLFITSINQGGGKRSKSKQQQIKQKIVDWNRHRAKLHEKQIRSTYFSESKYISFFLSLSLSHDEFGFQVFWVYFLTEFTGTVGSYRTIFVVVVDVILDLYFIAKLHLALRFFVSFQKYIGQTPNRVWDEKKSIMSEKKEEEIIRSQQEEKHSVLTV